MQSSSDWLWVCAARRHARVYARTHACANTQARVRTRAPTLGWGGVGGRGGWAGGEAWRVGGVGATMFFTRDGAGFCPPTEHHCDTQQIALHFALRFCSYCFFNKQQASFLPKI